MRLLLVSFDELVHLWDGLALLRRSTDLGDPAYDERVALLERIGDLF